MCSEWDRFAKGEYERLAMEEEGGDDSEMIDAMDGWDSEDDSTCLLYTSELPTICSV